MRSVADMMSGPPTIQDHVGQPPTPGHEVEFDMQRQASEDASLTTLEEHTPHVSEAVSSVAERERQHEERALETQRQALETQKQDLDDRERRLNDREKQILLKEEELRKCEDDLKAEEERLQAGWEKLRENKATTDRSQATTTGSQLAAYHVQSGTTAAKFQRVIDDVADRSGIPKESFVSAEPEHKYPLVLLFVKPSGPRLADGVVKYEEVEVCRKMVAPGGSLFICTMRGGNDPQAAKDLPAGCPPVEGLLDFCYISGDAQKPHTLNQASKMNDRSTRELAEAFKKVRPPSPPDSTCGRRLQIAITCLGKAMHKCYLIVVRCVSAIAESVGVLSRGRFSPHRL